MINLDPFLKYHSMSDEELSLALTCKARASFAPNDDCLAMDAAGNRIEELTAKLGEVEAERDAALAYGPKADAWIKNADKDRLGWKARAEAAEARERDAYKRGQKEALLAAARLTNCFDDSELLIALANEPDALQPDSEGDET